MRPLLRATFLANRNEGKNFGFRLYVVGAIQVWRFDGGEIQAAYFAQSANGLKI
jgi:hypothetical protein